MSTKTGEDHLTLNCLWYHVVSLLICEYGLKCLSINIEATDTCTESPRVSKFAYRGPSFLLRESLTTMNVV